MGGEREIGGWTACESGHASEGKEGTRECRLLLSCSFRSSRYARLTGAGTEVIVSGDWDRSVNRAGTVVDVNEGISVESGRGQGTGRTMMEWVETVPQGSFRHRGRCKERLR